VSPSAGLGSDGLEFNSPLEETTHSPTASSVDRDRGDMEAPPLELDTQQLDYIKRGQQLTEKDGGTDTDDTDLLDVPPPPLLKSMSKRLSPTDDDSDFDSDVMVHRTAKRKATKGQKWDKKTEKLPPIPRPQKNILADAIDACKQVMDLCSTKLDLRHLKYESEAR